MTLCEPHWSGSEEEHGFRSKVIQWLLNQGPSGNCVTTGGGSVIPRVVVQYWHDLDALPSDVRECLDSWKELEKDGFEIKLFDDRIARRFIAENYTADSVAAFDSCYHPAMRSDYFRMCYLLALGGFYVDADEFYRGGGCESFFQDDTIKLQPLCYDTATNGMVDAEEFLNDTEWPSSRIFYVNNNPLIAPPGHPLLRIALSRSTFLLQRSRRPEIQSTTGPGNLSASLVRRVIQLKKASCEWDFTILRHWTHTSDCRWFLSYRNDERNWRLLKTKEE